MISQLLSILAVGEWRLGEVFPIVEVAFEAVLAQLVPLLSDVVVGADVSGRLGKGTHGETGSEKEQWRGANQTLRSLH